MTTDLYPTIAARIGDPGAYVERKLTPSGEPMESVPRWAARAVVAAVEPVIAELTAELEKVRGQYADTRRHNDLLTAELADQQRANTTWADENQRLRDRLFADKPVINAALAWAETVEDDNRDAFLKATDALHDAVESYRLMDMALDAAHTEQAEVAR